MVRAGHPVDLSPTEFKLLRYLMLNPGRVLSKSQILDHVWQYDWGGDANIVESYISYLRRKIDQLDDADGRRLPAAHPHQARGGLPAARVVVTADVGSTAAPRPRPPPLGAAFGALRDWWAGTTLVSRLVGIVTVLLAVGLVLAGATSAALLEGTLVAQVDTKLQTEGEDLAQSTVQLASAAGSAATWPRATTTCAYSVEGDDDADHLAVDRGSSTARRDVPDHEHRRRHARDHGRAVHGLARRSPGRTWRAVAYPFSIERRHRRHRSSSRCRSATSSAPSGT